MLQVCSRMTPPTLQQPPAHEEQQQRMFHHCKAHIGIRDYAPYGCEWDGKNVIICPLPMGQEIDDTMSEHADKEGQCWFIEDSGQDEAGTHHDKRMHSNCHGMQCRVVQECMKFRSHNRVRKILQIMRHKAQG